MSDPLFVGAAYATVLAGLTMYVGSVARRLREARRTAIAVERKREGSLPGASKGAEETTATPPREPMP